MDKMEIRSAVSMTLFVLLTVTLGVLWKCDATIQVARPRGVSLSNEPLYNRNGKDGFTCLDGSMKILWSQLNDDYCDCPDSSDEPGTSACPNGRFHCNNKGYRPKYIPSSRVNDGICDCCDASDEYEGPGADTCVNNCKELGKKDLEERRQQMELFNKGFDIRQQYIKDGQAKKVQREEELKKLQTDREEAQKVVDEKKKVRDEAEKPEIEAKDKHKAAWEAELAVRKAAEEKEKAQQAFKELDANSDGRVMFDELSSRSEFDTDNSGDVNEEEAKNALGGFNVVEEAVFVEQVWSNIKDKFKFASQVAAEQAEAEATNQRDQQANTPPADEPAAFDNGPYEDDDFDDDLEEDEWADDDDDEDFDDEDEDDFDDTEDEAVRNLREERRLDRLARRREMREKRKQEAAKDEMPDYDEATKALIATADQARNEFDEADKNLKNIDRSISDLEKQLRVDLGPDQEFQPLQGECYEYTDREYTYKLCPFEKSSQRSKHGGSETSLGSWHQWEGPADNKYSVMMYTRGQKCWNGPDRSTKVILKCGTDNKLTSASEPDRCVYQFEFTTPALCSLKYDLSTGETDTHDEL